MSHARRLVFIGIPLIVVAMANMPASVRSLQECSSIEWLNFKEYNTWWFDAEGHLITGGPPSGDDYRLHHIDNPYGYDGTHVYWAEEGFAEDHSHVICNETNPE